MNNEKKAKILKPMMIMLILMVLLFGGIYFYKSYTSAMMKKAMSESAVPPVAVSAMVVPSEPWQSQIKATATVRAINGVDVTTEVGGLVKAIKQDAGKDVKVGDILVELNADVEIAHLHSLEADEAIAKINYTRDKAQFAFQGVSQATLDADEATLKSKAAQVVEQAAVVAKKTIRAPFSGRLGIININLGQFLNPADKIVTLQSLDPIYIDFYLPQQDLPKLRINQPVHLTTDAYPSLTFKGKITTINPILDSATRNVTIEATVENAGKKLLPGMFGVIKVTVGAPKEYLTLPQAAITYNPYGDAVYILKEKEKDKEGKQIFIANQKFVNLGETRGDQVQILKGIEKGDRVVTAGQLKIKNGSLVFIENKVVPTNNPSSNYKNK